MLRVRLLPLVCQLLLVPLTGRVARAAPLPLLDSESPTDDPGSSYGPCESRPSINDWLYVYRVDAADEGSCVESHLHQAGVLREDSGSPDAQPYRVSFPDGECWFREDEVYCEGSPSPNPPPPPSPPACSSDLDCADGSYCDSTRSCYSCDYITPSRCDDASGNCCSDDFLYQCPYDPAECNAPPPTPPPPAPDVGSLCDLERCECDGVSLAALKDKVYRMPSDAEGYAYSLSVCGEIPKTELPSGCQQYAEHPSVVKFKDDNPADCIEIGSIGPCSQGECGMFGKRSGSHLTVTLEYTYGCKNTFTIDLSEGSDAHPGMVVSNECSYTTSWAAPIDGTHHRCVSDKCVKVADGLPGVDRQTCEAACGPVSRCLSALNRVCGASKRASSDDCEYCTGSHHLELSLEGCDRSDYDSYCGAR